MARFYGWTHSEILSLPVKIFRLHFRNVYRIQANETLDLVQAISLASPFADEMQCAEALREIRRIADGRPPEPPDGIKKLREMTKDTGGRI